MSSIKTIITYVYLDEKLNFIATKYYLLNPIDIHKEFVHDLNLTNA